MQFPSYIEPCCAWARSPTRTTQIQRNFLSWRLYAQHAFSSAVSRKILLETLIFSSSCFKVWRASVHAGLRRIGGQEMRMMTTIWNKLFGWLGTGREIPIIPELWSLALKTPLLHISLRPGQRILTNRFQLGIFGLFYGLWQSWTYTMVVLMSATFQCSR